MRSVRAGGVFIDPEIMGHPTPMLRIDPPLKGGRPRTS